MLSDVTYVQGIIVILAQVTCVIFVVSFLVFCFLPPLHKPIRSYLHPAVVHHVERGLDVVLFLQRYEAPWLTVLFEVSSHSVSVAFYGSFLPALMWCGFPELCWHLVILMTLTLYVGNAIKDLIAAPRPMGLKYGKEKLKLIGRGVENLNAQEYGLPSSHTMNTLALNFYAVHYLKEKALLTDHTAALCYATVAAWVIWIALSRIYLGLHTPIDIIVGAVAGLTVVIFFTVVDVFLDQWVEHSPFFFPQLTIISLALLRLHPKPPKPTPSFEFSTSFMGVFFGVMAAARRSYHTTFYKPPIQVLDVFAEYHNQPMLVALKVARRLLVGFALMLLSKKVFKAISYSIILPLFYKHIPSSIRRAMHPPVADSLLEKNRLPWDLILTTRFIAYVGLGFAATELAPRSFLYFGW